MLSPNSGPKSPGGFDRVLVGFLAAVGLFAAFGLMTAFV